MKNKLKEQMLWLQKHAKIIYNNSSPARIMEIAMCMKEYHESQIRNLNDNVPKGWCAMSIQCEICTHRQVSVFPQGCDELECGNCGRINSIT